MRSELKWGSALSYIQMVLNVVIGIVYTPVMIRLLGRSEYGLYNTVSSTVSMLSVLNLGFNAGYVRYLAKYKHKNDYAAIERLNGLFLIVFTVLGLIGLLCGLFLTNNLNIVFRDGLKPDEYVIAEKLMLLLTINLALSFPMCVFSTIISANERFVFLKIVGMIKTVLSPLINLPLLLMGVRSVGLVVTSLILAIVTDSIYVYYVIGKLGNRFVFHGFEKGLFTSLFSYTAFIAINTIVDLVNVNVDRVLLGRFVGTEAVAVYAVGMSLYNYYQTLSTSISGVFTPRIHRYYNEMESSDLRDKQITDMFIRVGRIQCLILMLFASGMVVFGKDFIRYWAGAGYEESYYVMLLIMIPGSVPLMQNLGIEIQRAANKHQFRSIVYGIMATCNVILTIILCPRYGAVGAMIGTAISVVLANGFIMNYYYHHKLGINIPGFWKSICRILVGMLPVFLIGACIKWRVNYQNIWSLVLWIVVYAIVYCTDIWFLSMNQYEKRLVLSFIAKVNSRVGKGNKA